MSEMVYKISTKLLVTGTNESNQGMKMNAFVKIRAGPLIMVWPLTMLFIFINTMIRPQ